MTDYIVAIPSYKRYDEITKKTLPTLINGGVPKEVIHVFVANKTEEKLYKENKILDHGLEVGKQLAFVLSGGNTKADNELSEDDLYALELEAFMNLIQMPKTQERIKYTLETGKPLVN